MWAWWLIFLLFAAALGYFITWFIVTSRKFNLETQKELEKNNWTGLQRKDLKSPFPAKKKNSSGRHFQTGRN